MSNANLIAEARLNAPHSEDESLIMRLVVALEAKPRVVTTAEELDALPELCVIQRASGTVWRTCGIHGHVMPAHETDADWATPITANDFPITVLYTPTPDPTR